MAVECDPETTAVFQGFLSDDWMFYFASRDVSLFDFNPTTKQLEFVGVCGYFVFLKTLVQQRIAVAVKDSARPLLFIFRELDPLCQVTFESYTITFQNNGTLFAIVFTDNEECKQAFECIDRQVAKHFAKLLRRTKQTPEDARAQTVQVEECQQNVISFGNEQDKIDRYLNHNLPFFNLPQPFEKLKVPQTCPLTQPLPPDIDVPDPRQNQRHTMALNPPVIPIDVLQAQFNPLTSPLVSPRGNPPKVHLSRTTVSERRLVPNASPPFDRIKSPGSSKSTKTVLNIPLSPRGKKSE